MTDLDLTQEELEELMSEPPVGLGEGHSQSDLEFRATSGLDTYPYLDPDA